MQNWSLSGEMCKENLHKFGCSLPINFQQNLSQKFDSNFPWNQPFFPWICFRKSCEIWHFIHDLTEALSHVRWIASKRNVWFGNKKYRAIQLHAQPLDDFIITVPLMMTVHESRKLLVSYNNIISLACVLFQLLQILQ